MVNDAYAPELLRSLFLYDPVTGRLHHKANRRRVKAGSYADSTRRADGYRQVALRLDGKQYQLKAHRVAWILEHGDIPDGLQVDHINGIRDDNRYSARAEPGRYKFHNRRRRCGQNQADQYCRSQLLPGSGSSRYFSASDTQLDQLVHEK